MAVEDREPICGFCWTQGIRQALVFQPRFGYWECPLCLSKTATPDEDEEAVRAHMEWLREQRESRNWPGSIIAHDHDKTLSSTRRLRPGGGSKSGRRRKRDKRGTKTFSGEPTPRETQQHNARIRRRRAEGYEHS